MAVKVKICGITSVGDGLAAAEAGADLLGFVFYERSPRGVSIPAAAAIIRELPVGILKAGVFVDPSRETVVQAIRDCGLGVVQFHGEESPAFCLQFGVMSVKAFRIAGPESLIGLPNYSTDAWLLDAFTPGKPGGTGETFNWELARQAGDLGRPIFLAGGLTPENVAQAIRVARPFAVDVSSGVEAAPGVKDHAKVRAFIRAAKASMD